MPQIIEPTAPEARRAVIQQSLDEIAAEVGTALRDAQLDFPVFLTVPSSGNSIATMACPLDPSDEDWAHAFSDRLSYYWATIGRRLVAWKATTLRGSECDDGRSRCGRRRGERGMTVTKRCDDKVEAKRRIIRQSLHEITAEIEEALRDADLRSPVNIVVPSRHSLVTIGSARDVPPDEWSRMSAIVRQVLNRKLGAKGLRGRPLTSGMAKAATDIAFDTRS